VSTPTTKTTSLELTAARGISSIEEVRALLAMKVPSLALGPFFYEEPPFPFLGKNAVAKRRLKFAASRAGIIRRAIPSRKGAKFGK
jgi:hypothetical protein